MASDTQSDENFWRPHPGVKRRFVDWADRQLHVRIKSPTSQTEQPPLYCIHQSPSSSVAMAAVVAAMGEDRPCAAGDTPGFGESDPPTEPPEIEDYAAAHGAIIDALGWAGPIDVMGFFTGSKIAVSLALSQPQKIRRLILLGAPLYSDAELEEERTTYKPDVYDWDAGHLMKWWSHLKKGAPQPYPLSLFTRHFAEIQRGGPESWWGHKAAFNVDLRIQLPNLTQPTMVFCTADPQGQKSIAAIDLLKNGSRVDLPYMGQGVLDLHTETVCGHIHSFLDT
ncbi:MAG: alpha/beta hydrolase [Rhodospirillaceae bacterium]|jgi:pimeloyl-ACP methyl ester carboxylesterase|nr:alpha/beta hydrolase [Rhodospirillaceae bacterium]MBT5565873.1 alpha/beta hydrolase [Rhodospirillaceae bacterium]MBT6088706.1 alpha/beta hydrolase [Rhodospirillaceae bacterium]MBT6959508.1 alpha/beta hydrolase [Rhodospirillaceae bacterium]